MAQELELEEKCLDIFDYLVCLIVRASLACEELHEILSVWRTVPGARLVWRFFLPKKKDGKKKA